MKGFVICSFIVSATEKESLEKSTKSDCLKRCAKERKFRAFKAREVGWRKLCLTTLLQRGHPGKIGRKKLCELDCSSAGMQEK